ncbi:HNH endonuclease signature motif containing protein [Bacillus altitudinis]|uniref:HNH endonuclease signature motif containing protein n=1 Tax=Bacillus altitudinis TaxID=293387 RepID=UPI00064CB1E2|nr:HNH endonuclease signature motif containing protein [Bacillus altitudinis]KLV19209.1 hypothetical protein ABW03_14675 [Bacillus altitudinis]
MIKLESPSLNYRNVLIKCVQGIHDKALQKRVYDNIDNFKSRSETYVELANGKKLFQIDGAENDSFTYPNMTFLYSKLRDSQHSRPYYDYILGTSLLCPYCGVQSSNTLDHYLPKKHYPMYSVDPVNLLPCCSDCNSKKLEHKQLEGLETFHPYFDTLGHEKFLFAELANKDDNLAFKYYVSKPDTFSDDEFIKMENLFNLLELDNFYSVLASGEIHSQIYQLKELYRIGGDEAVAQSLNDLYVTNLNIGVNSWKTALYEGVKGNTWFCNEGIHQFNYISQARDETLASEQDLQIPTSK